ncbi:MAG: LacI family DNA-binding transcriptional regulator [Sphaerochaetaceae bacterium]
MKEKLTLKEIAARAGVSIATVSRVVAKSPLVKADTKERVLSIMEEGGYSPARKKSGLIAFIVPDILNPFFPLLLKSIETISKMQGYRMILCNSEYNTKIESDIIHNLAQTNIDGLIYVGAGEAPTILKELIEERNLPVVCLDRNPGLSNASLVTVDNIDGMYQSTAYLLGFGHRRILYLSGPTHLSTEKLRLEGFKKALADYNVPFASTCVRYGHYFLNDACEEVSTVIAQKLYPFSAICAANDLMAMGAYKALSDHGIRVPEEVSLIGYDGIPLVSAMGITSVRQPYEEMGREAVIMLLNMISDANFVARKMIMGASLIIRKSCATVGTHQQG